MLTGIFEIDTETYEQMIKFNIKSGGNLLVLGQAGIGKTEIPFQIAKKMGIKAYYWNFSTQEVPDLIGLPLLSKRGGVAVVEYSAPPFLPVMELTPQPVMIIIDEIDKAKPELQNPLLEVLQSKTLNDRKLNIQCIVATGNLPDENAFSKPISHALTNRCKVFRLRHNYEAWAEWAVNDGINPLVIGFLSRNPEYLSQPPIEGDPTAYARCSPRSWSKAARDLNTYGDGSDIDFQTLLVAGYVGQEPAAKFRVWLDHYRHIENVVDELVKSGKVPSLSNMSSDRVLVLSISACGILNSTMGKTKSAKPSEKENLNKSLRKMAQNVFGFLKNVPPEYQVAAVKSTITPGHLFEFKLTEIPGVMDVYNNIRFAYDRKE